MRWTSVAQGFNRHRVVSVASCEKELYCQMVWGFEKELKLFESLFPSMPETFGANLNSCVSWVLKISLPPNSLGGEKFFGSISSDNLYFLFYYTKLPILYLKSSVIARHQRPPPNLPSFNAASGFLVQETGPQGFFPRKQLFWWQASCGLLSRSQSLKRLKAWSVCTFLVCFPYVAYIHLVKCFKLPGSYGQNEKGRGRKKASGETWSCFMNT